jgi:hypothetical protein
VTDPYGGAPSPPPAPLRRSPGRPPRWATVGLPLVLAGLIAVCAVGYVLVDRERAADLPAAGAPASGSVVPPAELAGEWAGEGVLARCVGFDAGCSRTRSVTLTIDCTGQRCVVTPGDGSYGRPPLEVEDGSHRAVGPVPADRAPTCGGSPTASAAWQLDLTVLAGRLVGSYAETTIQSFDCGATGVAWHITLDRT